MRKMVIAAAMGVAVLGSASAAYAWGPHGHGGMGGGRGDRFSERDTPLTAAQVKDIIEGKIAWRGEDLVVASVEPGADGRLVASVTKRDGAPVRTLAVDPKTGRFSRKD